MKRWWLIAPTIAVAITGVCLFRQAPVSPSVETRPVFSIKHIDGIEMVTRAVKTASEGEVESDRHLSLEALAEKDDRTDKEIHAVVLPHHTLIGKELDGWWATLARQAKPSVIVVIGPNHENAGESLVQTTHGVWPTPFGDVKTDEELVDELIKRGAASEESRSFINEHAIGTHAPYLAAYFPDVPIVPIIGKSPAGREAADRTIRALEDMLPPDALIIASIDFCHYLDEQKTAEMDAETLELINQRHYDVLETMHSDHFDSPFALIAYFLWSDAHKGETELVWHSSSHRILDNPQVPGTSYLVYFTW